MKKKTTVAKTVVKAAAPSYAPSFQEFVKRDPERFQVHTVGAPSKQYDPSKATKPAGFLRAKVGEHKGHPVLSLRRAVDDAFPFTFGLVKAKLIVEHFDEIRQFVQDSMKQAAA